MKKILILLFSLAIFSQSFAQHNIEFKFKIRFQASQHVWTSITVIDSSSFTEGSYYTIPEFTMPEAQAYLQPAYNAIVGATFGIDEGAINNNIRLDITLNGITLDGHYRNPVNDQALFLVLDVDVYDPVDLEDPITEHFWFNTGHAMTFTIPLHEDFISFITSIELTRATLAFAYIANDLFSSNNITTTITASELSFTAEHLSTFGGGGNEIVSVENNNDNEIPTKFTLNQNYPNPFNPTTKIKYSLAKTGFVSINVYNVLGSKVATLVSENMEVGNHEVEFSAVNLPSGIYFYTLVSNNLSITKKMMLIK